MHQDPGSNNNLQYNSQVVRQYNYYFLLSVCISRKNINYLCRRGKLGRESRSRSISLKRTAQVFSHLQFIRKKKNLLEMENHIKRSENLSSECMCPTQYFIHRGLTRFFFHNTFFKSISLSYSCIPSKIIFFFLTIQMYKKKYSIFCLIFGSERKTVAKPSFTINSEPLKTI